MAEHWNPAVEGDQFWRRVQAIVADRINALTAEDRRRIARSDTTTMANPEGGGWVRLWVEVRVGGPPVELGRVHVASFAREDLHPN
jgi:hypothetical protein